MAVPTETWGPPGTSGTDWTVAQGADNDWYKDGERFTHTRSIVDGKGRLDGGKKNESRTKMLLVGSSETDVDIIAKVTVTKSRGHGIIVRRTATNTYYAAGFSGGSTNSLWPNTSGAFIGVNNGGTRTTLANDTGVSGADNTYWIRFQVAGSDLKLKLWADGTSEPSTWTLTATDSSIAGPGEVGIGVASVADGVFDWQEFGPASGGGTPQTVPVGVASETETAHPVGWLPGPVAFAVGVAAEVETVHPVGTVPGPVAFAVGAAAEVETVWPVAWDQTFVLTFTVGTVAEAEMVHPVGMIPGPVTFAVGAAAEIETVHPVGIDAVATVTIGAASETETVWPVGFVPGPTRFAVGVAVETETAHPVAIIQPGGGIVFSVGTVTEVESVHPVNVVPGPVSFVVGVAVEAETVRPVGMASVVSFTVGGVAETETVHPVGVTPGPVSFAVGVAVEVETVHPVGIRAALAAGTVPTRLILAVDDPNLTVLLLDDDGWRPVVVELPDTRIEPEDGRTIVGFD